VNNQEGSAANTDENLGKESEEIVKDCMVQSAPQSTEMLFRKFGAKENCAWRNRNVAPGAG
jgi:hypothetical protein